MRKANTPAASADENAPGHHLNLKTAAVLKVWRQCKKNARQAAEALGCSRSAVNYHLKKAQKAQKAAK